jgi:hypothetical protein
MATTPYNPFADRKYSREQLLAVFGPKPTVNVTRLYNESPQIYREMKLQAMDEHLLGPDSLPIQPAPYTKAPTHVAPTSFSDAELLSLPGMDEASLVALFKGSSDKHAIRSDNNLGNLVISDPNKYAVSKRAAQLRGILHDPNKNKNQEPVQPSGSFMLSDSLCEKAQLPKGCYMDSDSYGKLILTLNEREVAKAEAAAKSEKQ